MKKIALILLMALFAMSIVYGAACTVNIVENCTVEANIAVNVSKSPYSLIDHDGDGVIVMNTDDAVLDFGFADFIGNSTPGSIGVYIAASATNVTMQNMNMTGYTYRVKVNSTTQPDFSSVSQTIRNITYQYSSTNKALLLDCEGSGSIGITGLSNLVGAFGYYAIYRDGNFVSYATSNDYTISTCSTWSISATDRVQDSLTTSERSLYFVMVFLIIFGTIFTLVNQPEIGIVAIALGATLALAFLKTII